MKSLVFHSHGQELLYPEMNELFIDPFVSHVYKAVLSTLNGCPKRNLETGGEKPKKRKRTQADPTDMSYKIPPSFQDPKQKFLALVKEWDISVLQNLALDKYAGPTLERIIECDLPDKSKKSKESKESKKQTLSELLLFGKDVEPKGA
jgi:hypothetical protein